MLLVQSMKKGVPLIHGMMVGMKVLLLSHLFIIVLCFLHLFTQNASGGVGGWDEYVYTGEWEDPS